MRERAEDAAVEARDTTILDFERQISEISARVGSVQRDGLDRQAKLEEHEVRLQTLRSRVDAQEERQKELAANVGSGTGNDFRLQDSRVDRLQRTQDELLRRMQDMEAAQKELAVDVVQAARDEYNHLVAGLVEGTVEDNSSPIGARLSCLGADRRRSSLSQPRRGSTGCGGGAGGTVTGTVECFNIATKDTEVETGSEATPAGHATRPLGHDWSAALPPTFRRDVQAHDVTQDDEDSLDDEDGEADLEELYFLSPAQRVIGSFLA